MHVICLPAVGHRKPISTIPLFYLTVRQGATIKDDIGYIKGPMGINPQNDIVKNVCTRGGLTGKKTTHNKYENNYK